MLLLPLQLTDTLTESFYTGRKLEEEGEGRDKGSGRGEGKDNRERGRGRRTRGRKRTEDLVVATNSLTNLQKVRES